MESRDLRRHRRRIGPVRPPEPAFGVCEYMAQLGLGFLAAPSFLGGPEGDVGGDGPPLESGEPMRGRLWVRLLVPSRGVASGGPPITLVAMKRLLVLLSLVFVVGLPVAAAGAQGPPEIHEK